MNLERTIRRVLRLVSTTLRLTGWTLGTCWLGSHVIWSAVRHVPQIPLLFRSSTHCGRGHRVSLVGPWRCTACGARYEGHAFVRCPNCGARAGYVECHECGLGVRDVWR